MQPGFDARRLNGFQFSPSFCWLFKPTFLPFKVTVPGGTRLVEIILALIATDAQLVGSVCNYQRQQLSTAGIQLEGCKVI